MPYWIVQVKDGREWNQFFGAPKEGKGKGNDQRGHRTLEEEEDTRRNGEEGGPTQGNYKKILLLVQI